MGYVRDSQGRNYVRQNVRCVCGAMLAERLEPTYRRSVATGDQVRVPCERCRYLVWKFAFGHGKKSLVDPRTGHESRVKKRDVTVLQRFEADTGRVLPGEVEIIVWADPRRMTGDRGGHRLPAPADVLRDVISAFNDTDPRQA